MLQRRIQSLSRKRHNQSALISVPKNLEVQKKRNRSTTRKLEPRPSEDRTKLQSSRRELGLPRKKSLQLFELGKAAYQQQRFEEAIVLFKQSVGQSSQCLFYLGSCYMSCGKYSDALEALRQYRLKNHKKEETYLLLSICYSKLGQSNRGIQILNTLIGLFPSCYNAYLYRAKLKLKLKRLDEAEKEFTFLTKSDKDNPHAFVGRGDVLLSKGMVKAALECYSHAIELSPDNPKLRLKRIQAYLMIRMFEEAQAEIARLVQQEPSNQDYLLLRANMQVRKARLLNDPDQINTAELLFQLCFRDDPDSRQGQKALAQIIRLKISQRNFYEAAFNCERIPATSQNSELAFLKRFSQGVVCLMKRKFDEGVAELTKAAKLAKKNQLPEVEEYLCFGLMHQQKIEQSLQYYRQLSALAASRDPKELESLNYNRLLCQGICNYKTGLLDEALCNFQQASNIRQGNLQPAFYKAITLVNYALTKIPLDQENGSLRLQMLLTALKEYQNCSVREGPNSANLLYHRALLLLLLGHLEEAKKDIFGAVEHAEDSVPKYYYLRAVISCQLREFEQAELDFLNCFECEELASLALNNMTMVQLALGELDKAATYLKEYEHYTGQAAEDHRALLHFCRGEFKLAESFVNKGTRLKLKQILMFVLGKDQLSDCLNKGALFAKHPLAFFVEELGLNEREEHVLAGLNYFQGKNFALALKEFNLFVFQQIEDELDPQQTLQMRYNAALCELGRGSVEKGCEMLQRLRSRDCPKISELLQFIRSEEVELDQIFFEPFECQFSKHLDWTSVQVGGRLINARPALSRLYFRPVVQFDSDCEFLLEECSWKCVEMKPEAPWILRDKNGVIFTNKVDKACESDSGSSSSSDDCNVTLQLCKASLYQQ